MLTDLDEAGQQIIDNLIPEIQRDLVLQQTLLSTMSTTKKDMGISLKRVWMRLHTSLLRVLKKVSL